jgi:Tfp pilus assembly protein PilN
MTVLSSETALWSAQAALPRVNLLPPEIAQKRALRRLQLALGAVGVGAVAVVGLLYTSASHSVSSAESELTAAKAQTTRAQAEVAKYRSVSAIYAAADAAQAQLGQAMGDEVRFSQLLNDLSLSIPSNVWITNLAYARTAPVATAGAAGTATATGTTATAVPPVGTLSVSGTAFTHDDVALWLDALAGLKTYADPYFSNATETLIGQRKIVNFTSTATLTDKALSHRYGTRVGG